MSGFQGRAFLLSKWCFVFTCGALMTPPQIAADDLFVRGDSNVDGEVNFTDPVFTLNAFFAGGSPLTCHDAADADDNGSVQLTDAVLTLNFLFLNGERPPFPFPHCGADQTEDSINCESSPSCTPTFSFFTKEFAGDGVFFVIDRSPSAMGGLERAKDEITRSLGELPDGSQFGIVFFDRGIARFPQNGRPAKTSQELIASAIEWVNAVPQGAGSCFREGLLATLEFVDFSTARRNVVMYVGDGGGTCGLGPPRETEGSYLERTVRNTTEANNDRAQINTFGVLRTGRQGIQESFLIQLAELNGGIYTRVN